MFGRLRFYAGVMGSGKSALALQTAHHRRAAGRVGALFTSLGRDGDGLVTSRLGLTAEAHEFTPETDLAKHLVEILPPRGFVIIDEAQFLTSNQVDQLAWAADELALDIDCFGLMTAFDTRLFPGSRRLVEMADETIPLQVEVTCWCGRPGRINARVEDGQVARSGGQVAVGDVVSGEGTHYRVLCRSHWRQGDLGPHASEPTLPLALPESATTLL
ncbi:thymidine kinase [Modestobacter roseus]|uniref:thymidine kinase n=1 Tax=Modestobacter roseus TaxID=1181884 RepID=UPI001297A407|nr:thymidine kinase [Modestobacter roseus]MQA35798.1 thymidine kinase [Modestobacter roseus]